VIEIEVSSLFKRRFKKLPKEIRDRAIQREKIFVRNPFDSRLGTHKLHGKRKEEWAYWIDYSYRITFIFLTGSKVLYTDIGTHGDLYR